MEFGDVFSSRLKAARKQYKLTQVQVAKEAGLTPTWISDFECGRRVPSLKNFQAICWAFAILGNGYFFGNIADDLLNFFPEKPTEARLRKKEVKHV